MIKLGLTDLRDPARFGFLGAHWAKTADEAIEALKTGEVTFASLDHDLTYKHMMGRWDDGVKTGYEVVLWMRDNNVWPPDGVQVHSLNKHGAQRMMDVLTKHAPTVLPLWPRGL